VDALAQVERQLRVVPVQLLDARLMSGCPRTQCPVVVGMGDGIPQSMPEDLGEAPDSAPVRVSGSARRGPEGLPALPMHA